MVKEAKEGAVKETVPVIKILDITSDIFEKLLRFMYAGECSLIRPMPSKV